MKHLIKSINCLTAVAFLALAIGCATDLQNKENLAVAAMVATPTSDSLPLVNPSI
jgi:hypothetical protein